MRPRRVADGDGSDDNRAVPAGTDDSNHADQTPDGQRATQAVAPVALTVAGSDPSGGAGAQADLKTFHQHGVYGAAVMSLLTVQNTRGCEQVVVLDAALVAAQLRAVLTDLPVRVLKTGALGSAANVRAVAECLRDASARRPPRVGEPDVAQPLLCVVDPVRLASAGPGGALLAEDARDVLRRELLPQVTVLTPNLAEAAWLTGREVQTLPQARDAARALLDLGPRAVLVKGGHLRGPAVDVLAIDGSLHELRAERVETRAGHGTGCSLASAIAARLAHGEPMLPAVIHAKAWVREALVTAPERGGGTWPLNHFAPVPLRARDD
ncbi:MAG: bifunctional hydroxymethylpyrimidine kinase/phosphomethylpyrimidine kinase [Sandaracinaceae bacterium]|nr:bifunctional hydroxymethylpyrimidine kinase/phosphomethylpyrimidine kinase [Sandaracinaceae bacterium]